MRNVFAAIASRGDALTAIPNIHIWIVYFINAANGADVIGFFAFQKAALRKG